jgi:hypothetical protein
METRNPYQPPAAAVSDVPEPVADTRPMAVTRAIQLLWSALAIGVVLSLWDLFADDADKAYFWVSIVAIAAGLGAAFLITLWVNGAAYAGKNWGRIAIVVLTVLGAIVQVWSFTVLASMEEAPPFTTIDVAGVALQNLMTFAAIFLLYTPASNAWYRAIKARR